MEKAELINTALHIGESAPNPKNFLARVKSYAAKHGIVLDGVEKKGLDDGTIVHKAFNPVGKTWVVEKAWTQDDGSLAIEGWISTNHPDLEKDVVEPEAFYGETFEEYFSRSAPLSSNHDTDGYPIGHLQKGVLVRDGVIFQEEYHPTDPSEFSHFNPATKGTGWYGRGVITDERVASHVQKGNLGAFSWIGNLKAYEPLTGGGRRYHLIDPLIESTVAAYPVNPKAVMQIAKAYGLDEGKTMTDKNPERDPLDLENLLVKAAEVAAAKAKEETDKAMKGAVDASQLGDLLLQFESRMTRKIEETVSKGKETEETDETVGKGVGRKSTQTVDPREDNPVRYLVTKGRTAAKEGKDIPYDDVDKQVIWELTRKGLSAGMLYEPAEATDFGDN